MNESYPQLQLKPNIRRRKSAAPWQGCTSVNTVFLRKQSELGFGYMSSIYLGIS